RSRGGRRGRGGAAGPAGRGGQCQRGASAALVAGGNTVTSHGLGHVGGVPAFSWFQVLLASVRGRVVPAVTGGTAGLARISPRDSPRFEGSGGEKGKPDETTYAAGLLGPAAVCRAGGEPARAGHGTRPGHVHRPGGAPVHRHRRGNPGRPQLRPER